MRPLLVAALGTGLGVAGAAAAADSPAEICVRLYQKHASDLRYGHCHFEPSCSQYALDAFDRHGTILGAALTADRLIRCHPGAHRYHLRGENGRLADTVDHLADVPGTPRAPDWLIPVPMDDPLPRSLAAGGSDRDARLREYAAFGDHLAEEGDCWRAETEYGRVGFLAGTAEALAWSRRRAAACLFREEDWEGAAGRFREAADVDPDETGRSRAHSMAVASLFNAGEFRESTSLAHLEIGAGRESCLFLIGLGSMALGDWDEAAREFENIGEEYPDSPNRDRAVFLRWKADEGHDVPRKRPILAAGMSAVIPGSGQMYTGRFYDGFRHILVNGALVYGVYRLFKAESYVGGYLLAGFTLPFYVGNVVGAKRGAESYNAAKRAEYVSRVIFEAGRE